MSLIKRLTAEQEVMIPVYLEKWWRITLSTQPINRQRVQAAVNSAYAAMGRRSPDIFFVSGPYELRETLSRQSLLELLEQSGAPLLQNPLMTTLSEQVRSHLDPELVQTLADRLQARQQSGFAFRLQTALWEQLGDLLGQLQEQVQQQEEQSGQVFEHLLQQLWAQQQTEWRRQFQQQPMGRFLTQLEGTLQEWGKPVSQFMEDTVWSPLERQPLVQEWERQLRSLLGMIGVMTTGFSAIQHLAEGFHPALLNYCFGVLDCPVDWEKWQALRSLATECGSILMFEQACIVCDRPTRLMVDPERRLHAEGEPALAYADSYQVYSYQDVQLPERYGALHPNLWQAQWLLGEDNAELRRVLIQGIGYARICQELHAIELDSWREYTLLRIDQAVDVEPVYLLKMTCPSTHHIHATRVPPDMRAAREAIRWVNHGIDPEEFVMQT
ncbi:MAG: hypothetical protein QNJ46_06425 [Leptolyngbyaceae cyanobacterium MO_188.B28]|nr:hypothetical protein [Leptolyngbyaceae cyanobacterium MO_188.B28]